MRLFIWNKPYAVSYGSSCLYVLAENIDQARRAAKSALLCEYGCNPDPENERAHHVPAELGEPTRIVDGPYAEAYEWSD